MWSKIASLLSGGTVEAISRGVATFTGDKVQREENQHDEAMALRDQVAAEAAAAATRGSWWDSFVDGLNRLVRPTFTFGLAALFGWCVVDPEAFSAAMTALQLVPDPLWIIAGTVLSFWFGDRVLKGVRAPKMDAAKVRTVVEAVNTIRQAESRGEPVDFEINVVPLPDNTPAIDALRAKREIKTS